VRHFDSRVVHVRYDILRCSFLLFKSPDIEFDLRGPQETYGEAYMKPLVSLLAHVQLEWSRGSSRARECGRSWCRIQTSGSTAPLPFSDGISISSHAFIHVILNLLQSAQSPYAQIKQYRFDLQDPYIKLYRGLKGISIHPMHHVFLDRNEVHALQNVNAWLPGHPCCLKLAPQ
jgi:hypothetical protein